MHITIIGIGKMGLPMAQHIAKAGYSVSAFDRSPFALNAARELGITVTESIEEAIGSADVIISSLPHDLALLDVAKEIVQYARPKTVYIDTSTVSMITSAEVAALCKVKEVEYLRSTVSGNNKMAEAAQLTIMVSGPFDVFESIKPILATFGPTQFYLGAEEQARLMKLVINLMVAATASMLSEAVTLGQKGGLDWKQMWDVISASAVASPLLKAKALQLRENDYSATFTVAQMRKDVGLILATGAHLQVPMTHTSTIEQQLIAATAQGDVELDYAAVIRVVARAAGLNI